MRKDSRRLQAVLQSLLLLGLSSCHGPTVDITLRESLQMPLLAAHTSNMLAVTAIAIQDTSGAPPTGPPATGFVTYYRNNANDWVSATPLFPATMPTPSFDGVELAVDLPANLTHGVMVRVDILSPPTGPGTPAPAPLASGCRSSLLGNNGIFKLDIPLAAGADMAMSPDAGTTPDMGVGADMAAGQQQNMQPGNCPF